MNQDGNWVVLVMPGRNVSWEHNDNTANPRVVAYSNEYQNLTSSGNDVLDTSKPTHITLTAENSWKWDNMAQP